MQKYPESALWYGPQGWAIELAPDNVRLIAEAFPAPGGLVFADAGWNDHLGSGHPFHFVPGSLVPEDNGFSVGPIRIAEITEDHPLCWAWLEWLSCKTQSGESASRESCRRAIEQDGVYELGPGLEQLDGPEKG